MSLLHTVFDFLAFKNGRRKRRFGGGEEEDVTDSADISFWRKVDSMQGLSVRSIFTNM